MKINITGIRGIPAKHGGFETFAESLSIYLHGHQHEITVYCQSKGWGMTFENQWNGIRRITIPIPFDGAFSTIIFDLFSVLHVCLFSRSLTLVLGYNTAIFSIFFRLFGITSIMNMDGIEWQRPKWKYPAKIWFKFNETLGCIFSNHLIADHEEIKKHLETRHGSLSISTIPYGAIKITAPSESYLKPYGLIKNSYYLVIARPEPENSIIEIVTAFVASSTTKQLVLLGDYNQNVDYQAKVINIADDRVIFLGAIYDSSIVSALRYYCFAYLHGHTVGGTNPSLVEAMGAGCPIIANENPFNKGVCENGALYFNSSNDLKTIIQTINDELLITIKNKSYARFEQHYTLESILEKYEQLLLSYSQH